MSPAAPHSPPVEQRQTGASQELLKYDSVKRITQIPVVNSSCQYLSDTYSKLKGSNRILDWSLSRVEGSVQLVLEFSLPRVPTVPLALVDTLLCKGLDTVEYRIPAIKYPTGELVEMGREAVRHRVIRPVLRRADSVKQLGLTEASRVGELAASKIDTALDVADQYVDKYLPDSTDTQQEGGEKKEEGESKASQAIHHMNRLSKKLRRRLTKRTLVEAQALRQGGTEVARTLLYLADLLVRDPLAFVDKMTEVWHRLSEDEPENQVPPANLEQVLALVGRETARRAVHAVNYLASAGPAHAAMAVSYTVHHAQTYTNYVLKIAHLDGVIRFAFITSLEKISQIKSLILELSEASKSGANSSQVSEGKQVSGVAATSTPGPVTAAAPGPMAASSPGPVVASSPGPVSASTPALVASSVPTDLASSPVSVSSFSSAQDRSPIPLLVVDAPSPESPKSSLPTQHSTSSP